MADTSEKLQALVRSLNLIPYLRSHPNATAFEIAADLGTTPEDIKDAFLRLFCTGVGRNTEDLIDLSFSFRDGITVYNDQGLNQALRLTPTEAGALLITLESLEHMPGLVDPHAVVGAAAKIRGIMDEKTAAIYDSMARVNPEESRVQAAVGKAVDEQRRLRFGYWAATTNESRTRVVDPARIFIYDSEPYLVGWEEDRKGHRCFRLDRISDAELLEERANPRLQQLDFVPEDPFGFNRAERAEVLVHPEATWLADYYDIELGGPSDSGWIAATMPMGSPEWFVRFALGQADRMRVTAPDAVVEAIAQRKERALEVYTQ